MGKSSKITFHHKLQLLWLLSHIFLFYALFKEFSILKVFLAFIWTIMINIGSEAGAHRYFAHGSYKTTNLKKNLMIFLQTFAGEGSIVAFCGVHRQHHAHSDSPLDPHSPSNKSYLSIIYWFKTIKVQFKYVKESLNDKYIKFQHAHYFKFHLLVFLIVLFTLGPINYGYFFSLPIVLILYGNAMTNILGHSPSLGYRNYDTDDHSVNIGGLVNFLLMGGGMQNNHHAYPKSYTTKFKPHEKDSMGKIIDLFLKEKDLP